MVFGVVLGSAVVVGGASVVVIGIAVVAIVTGSIVVVVPVNGRLKLTHDRNTCVCLNTLFD